MTRKRVVVTGLGVVAPNGVGVDNFKKAIQNNVSGLRFDPNMEAKKFGCQVSGIPPMSEEEKAENANKYRLIKLRSSSLLYGVMAGMEAWEHAGLPIPANDEEPLWDTGSVFGAGLLGVQALAFGFPLIENGQVRKLGSRLVQQTMNSGVNAYLGGLLGLGNQLTANSSACATGTEAIIMGYERIVSGGASRMLVGSCESEGVYIWGAFDSMRVLNRSKNDDPTAASRPMSATARGFIPSTGAGALVIEDYEVAKARGATIYAEIVGTHANSGGQRQGGSMTAPNRNGIIRCVHAALKQANLTGADIDGINGHLTSTMADPIEVSSWVQALGRSGSDFPYINSLKSMVGHGLGAAGAMESVATVLQLYHGFFHASLNSEDLHEDISAVIDKEKVPQKTIENTNFDTLIKANFGFGDVNTCIIFKKIND